MRNSKKLYYPSKQTLLLHKLPPHAHHHTCATTRTSGSNWQPLHAIWYLKLPTAIKAGRYPLQVRLAVRWKAFLVRMFSADWLCVTCCKPHPFTRFYDLRYHLLLYLPLFVAHPEMLYAVAFHMQCIFCHTHFTLSISAYKSSACTISQGFLILCTLRSFKRKPQDCQKQ